MTWEDFIKSLVCLIATATINVTLIQYIQTGWEGFGFGSFVETSNVSDSDLLCIAWVQ